MNLTAAKVVLGAVLALVGGLGLFLAATIFAPLSGEQDTNIGAAFVWAGAFCLGSSIGPCWLALTAPTEREGKRIGWLALGIGLAGALLTIALGAEARSGSESSSSMSTPTRLFGITAFFGFPCALAGSVLVDLFAGLRRRPVPAPTAPAAYDDYDAYDEDEVRAR